MSTYQYNSLTMLVGFVTFALGAVALGFASNAVHLEPTKETSNPQYNLEIAAVVGAIALIVLGVAFSIYETTGMWMTRYF